LDATPARTTLRFTLAAGHPQTTIPAGTLARAADGETLFRTDTATTVAAGAGTADVLASCTQPGTAGNGFQAGEIRTLVQTTPFVTAVTNLSMAYGGAPAEDDDRFRQRIHLAPAKFSTAGSRDSYIYWALSAHPSIVDVAIWGDTEHPGDVYVCALLTGGVVPDSAMRDTLLGVISADTVRPLTDRVVYVDPVPVDYTISVELQIYANQTQWTDPSRTEAETRLQALADAWGQQLGRDIVPEAIVERVQALAGVSRAVVATPAYTEIGREEFPRCTAVVVTTAVVEEQA
jgi:phage-related baseplate assembly protein